MRDYETIKSGRSDWRPTSMKAKILAFSASHAPPRTIGTFIACVGCILAFLACAPHQAERTDPTLQSGMQVQEQAERLRGDQTKALYRFDTVITEGESACNSLCSGHTEICGISKRICAMSDKAPNNERTRTLCDKAVATCRQVTKRLPQECWCR